jgi:GABA permease
MESPFRSEAAAFRFLLITLGAFGLIVIAASIDVTLGLVTWIVLSAVAVLVYLRQRGPGPRQEHVEHVGAPDERRVLVVASETIGREELVSAIGTRAIAEKTSFLVVAPALTSSVKAWANDEDPARVAAQARLDEMLERLTSAGIEAKGQVGDSDPLVAIEDAVHTFSPDEIVISTHPPGHSSWHEKEVVESAAARFDVPVSEVIVEPEGPSETS